VTSVCRVILKRGGRIERFSDGKRTWIFLE
jgi:hypothetical protein